MVTSLVRFSQKLPGLKQFPPETILFYDRKTLQHPQIKNWILGFKYKIALNAGESLKTLHSYATTLNQVQKMAQTYGLGGSQLTFVALGGGSVGDFAGFVASTYQRGRKFISIPSTWLAAIDSAHGGKTGLNLNGVKNQIGTFYPATEIHICESVLKTLPPQALNDAFAEALKICLINRPGLFFKISKTHRSLFQHLPQLVKAKYDVVKKDPLEKKGLRKLLNLGHTVGHVFESMHDLTHGQAVFFGTLFSLRFSLKRKFISWDEFQFITEKLFSIQAVMTYQEALRMPTKGVRNRLMQDKKISSHQNVDFIFVRALGKTFVKSIQVDEIIQELLRQQQEL
ncbi:MAG: 3-dehydroquinate synthase [Moraxellaceae bacterium]|nr:3-dehydroquinate synthase [Pseudobdellovibrionaceae bacterium]